MNDAGAGGSGGSPRYGYDIFCDGEKVQRGGGNEGGVWEAFSRCLRERVCEPDKDRNRNKDKDRPPDSGINALLDPRSKEEYEIAVDVTARQIFRMICLVDKRKFLQASTCQPILDKDVIEILKVELKAVRNEVKAKMKQEQARRDEERSGRDREEFEREQQEKRLRQNQHRRKLPNGTSTGGGGGGGGGGRRCPNPVSPSPAYGFGGDHPAWAAGPRRQGSDRRSPFHRSDDHDAFAAAAAYDSDHDAGGRTAGLTSGPFKPDKLTQARQHIAEMQRKRKGAEPEERPRGDNTQPNRGRSNDGRAGGSASFQGHIPRKRSAASNGDWSKGNTSRSGEVQSKKKQKVGEKHRFKKLVSATEAASPPSKRKPIWEPPSGRSTALATSSLPTPESNKCGEEGHYVNNCEKGSHPKHPPADGGPEIIKIGDVSWKYCGKCKRWYKGDKPIAHTTAEHRAKKKRKFPYTEREAAKAKAMSSPRDQSMGHEAIGGSQQGPSPSLMKPPSSPVVPSGMPGAPDLAPPEDTTDGDDAGGGFDMDDSESPQPPNATLEHASTQSASKPSPRGDVEFTSVSSPFSKKRGLKVSRKKAASTASPESPSPNLSDNAIERIVEGRTEQKGTEEAVVKVSLESIVGLDGIVTIEPIGQDDYEKIDDPVVKERSSLCSKTFPPWPARVATDAESKKCLKEHWDKNSNIGRQSHVCVYVFYPPPRHTGDAGEGSTSSNSTFDASSTRGPECGIEFVHFSRIRPLHEDRRVTTTESSWSESYHRAWNVAAALRQWALASNMAPTVPLVEKITYYPHEHVGDYGVVFSIKRDEWASASHIGAQTVLNLILSNPLVKKHTTYSAEKYVAARAVRHQKLGFSSGTTNEASDAHFRAAAAPSSTEASFSNVLSLLGDDDDDDDGDDNDDLFDDGVGRDKIDNRTNVAGRASKGKVHGPANKILYDPAQDSTMDLDDVVGNDGIIMVAGNDANRSIHHPWPARIASAEESDEHRLKELKLGRDVDPYKICVFYFLPCWGDITELAGGVERWYFCDFVDSSRIHNFSDPDIDLNGMSEDIVLRYKRAWTIAAGLRFWSFGVEEEALRKPHKCKVNGCARIHEKIREYGPVLKIEDKRWIDGSNTLDPDSIVKVINKALGSKGICRLTYSDEKSMLARGNLGANYSSWLRRRCCSNGDVYTLSSANTSRNSRSASSRSSRCHDLFNHIDESRGTMTNGGAKIPIKSEHTELGEAKKQRNTRGTKRELDKIQATGKFCAKEDDVGSKTMRIFQNFAAVAEAKTPEENDLAKLIEDACNRLVVLEEKLRKNGINPDD